MEVNREAYDFYEKGAEIGRLERGIGKLEAARTQELLLRWLPEKAAVYDIGGGVGYYAHWLAGLGHQVTMVELAPAAVEYARSHQTAPYTALVGTPGSCPCPIAAPMLFCCWALSTTCWRREAASRPSGRPIGCWRLGAWWQRRASPPSAP